MLYSDILLLKDILENEKIPFEFEKAYDGYQLGYPVISGYICRVMEHRYSNGGAYDLLEIEGLTKNDEDGVTGYLTALDVAERIKSHWEAYEDIVKELYGL